MRHHRLLACGLSVILAASAAMTGYAVTENHSDGKQHTVNSDVVNEDSSKTAVTSVKEGTSVTVNGDVKSEGSGAQAWEKGELTVNGDVDAHRNSAGAWDSGTSVTVNGDVSVDGGDSGNVANAQDGGSLTVNGNVTSASDTKSAAVSQDGSELTVTGNVENTNAVTTGDHVPNTVLVGNDSTADIGGDVKSTAYGASVSKGSTVNIGGSVESELRSVRANDNSTVTVGKDVTSNTEEGVTANKNSTVTVGGDVTGGAAAVDANDSTVTVEGNVNSKGEAAVSAHNSTVNVGKNVDAGNGTVGVWAETGSTVNVGGSVTGNTGMQMTHAEGSSTVTVGQDVKNTGAGTAVDAKGGSKITVDGSVSSGGAAVISEADSAVTVSGNVEGAGSNVEDVGDYTVTASGFGSTVDVKGDIKSSSSAITAEQGAAVTVGGDVSADGASGVRALYDATVTVEGSVENKSGSAIEMQNNSTVIVKKDASGADGIVIEKAAASDLGSVIVLGKVTSTDAGGACITVKDAALTKEDMVKNLPTIIVGELASKNIVTYEDQSGQGVDVTAYSQAIADQILFYIDVQDPKNGTITLDSGTTNVKGYDVAHAEDLVTVTVTADNGYEIKTVDGGKATAKKNEDGSWSFTVPATGGVSISALMEAIRKVEESSSDNDDSGTKHNDSKQPEQTPYVSEKAADNSIVHVYGEAKAPDGTRAGAVFSDSEVQAGTVVVYAGEGKTAGLRDDAKAAIAAINSGDLAAVPGVDLNGKKAVGGTVAFGIVPDGVHDVPVSLYAPDLPSGAVPYILFYNNMTQQWILIPATVDPVIGLVEFKLPEDGTAVIVY